MHNRNQKIIDAVIEKAHRDCPGSLALIGIYGSFLTGDIHDKSDLDLLILINDDRGYSLAHTFILEDEAIGHDLYCTTWEMLESDAKFSHPHISKLMDSRIVYCADESYLTRLEELRYQAMTVDTRQAANAALAEAERSFAKVMLADNLSDVRFWAGNMMYQTMGAIALLNHRYFKMGTRRVFEEIEAMERKPKNLHALVDAFLGADSLTDMKAALSHLLEAVEALFAEPLPCPEVFPGTYEEMFSNWRNKMYFAAETGDKYLAFDSMCGLDNMLKELGFPMDVLGRFDPNDLAASANFYDEILASYRKEYDRAGIQVQSYPDVDAFIETYIKKETA